MLADPQTQKQWADAGAATPASQDRRRERMFLSRRPSTRDFYYSADPYAKPVAAPTLFNMLDPALMRAMDEILVARSGQALQSAHDEVTAGVRGRVGVAASGPSTHLHTHDSHHAPP